MGEPVQAAAWREAVIFRGSRDHGAWPQRAALQGRRRGGPYRAGFVLKDGSLITADWEF